MPGTPPTTPRFGAKRLASTDTFDIANDHNAAVDALDLAAKFTSSLSTARPSLPVVDQYNYSTDTNVLERWSGTAWVRPTPAPHAASHQDGGTDALTVREAMMTTGALGMAKGSFKAYRNATLASATTGSTLVFDTDSGADAWDVSNWYDITTGRYTPQVAAYYRLSWSIGSAATLPAAAQYIRADLWKNGALQCVGQINPQASAGPGVSSVGTAEVLANGTTDFFYVVLVQNTGAGIGILTGAPYTRFDGHLVGRS